GCFFFSSRRRHTRFSRDWSSDVCSSDLPARRKAATFRGESAAFTVRKAEDDTEVFSGTADGPRANGDTAEQVYVADFSELQEPRSEERRVGKECRSRASPWQQRNRQTTA